MAYIAEPFGPPTPAVVPVKPAARMPDKTRYASIDALKGIAILCYWLVIASIGNPALPVQLRPGPWGKPTLADCVYPALILGIGAGISLSAAYMQGRNSLGHFMLSALSRAFWLVLFGVLLESAVAKHFVFDLGIIQLIGVAYLFNALFAKTPVVLRFFFAEILLLAFYAWARMTFVPGSMAGTLTEKVNMIQYTNDKVLAPIGLQGLLALIPIASIMMSGTVLGSVFLLDESPFRRGLIIFGCGATLVFFGWLWSLDQPMAASIWTSSYALFATGMGTALLGLLCLICDSEIGEKISYPFRVAGSAIILALTGPILLKIMILDVWTAPGSKATLSAWMHNWIGVLSAPPLQDWIYPVGTVVFWWIVVAITYHRRRWVKAKSDL